MAQYSSKYHDCTFDFPFPASQHLIQHYYQLFFIHAYSHVPANKVYHLTINIGAVLSKGLPFSLILNSLSITCLYQKMALREFESLLALICLNGPIIFVYISVHGLFLFFFSFVRLLHMLASVMPSSTRTVKIQV